jgi:hypothetical protein
MEQSATTQIKQLMFCGYKKNQGIEEREREARKVVHKRDVKNIARIAVNKPEGRGNFGGV